LVSGGMGDGGAALADPIVTGQSAGAVLAVDVGGRVGDGDADWVGRLDGALVLNVAAGVDGAPCGLALEQAPSTASADAAAGPAQDLTGHPWLRLLVNG
jgi:hypothetical protein